MSKNPAIVDKNGIRYEYRNPEEMNAIYQMLKKDGQIAPPSSKPQQNSNNPNATEQAERKNENDSSSSNKKDGKGEKTEAEKKQDKVNVFLSLMEFGFFAGTILTGVFGGPAGLVAGLACLFLGALFLKLAHKHKTEDKGQEENKGSTFFKVLGGIFGLIGSFLLLAMISPHFALMAFVALAACVVALAVVKGIEMGVEKLFNYVREKLSKHSDDQTPKLDDKHDAINKSTSENDQNFDANKTKQKPFENDKGNHTRQYKASMDDNHSLPTDGIDGTEMTQISPQKSARAVPTQPTSPNQEVESNVVFTQ
jgi:hypothetical protein